MLLSGRARLLWVQITPQTEMVHPVMGDTNTADRVGCGDRL